MANATVTVLEADGTTQTDVVVLDVGRQAAAASKSTAMSTEDKAVLDAAVATLGATTGAAVITDANGTIQQYLRGLVKQWIAGTLVLGAGSNLVGKVTLATSGGTEINFTASSSASVAFTPAAASHVAGDANGAIGEFTSIGISASRIMITSASLVIAGTTAEATAWRLHLFNVTPPSALADDGAFVLPAGDLASYLGFVDLGTAVDLVDNQYVEVNGINKQIKLAGTSVFAYLTNLTTLTPAAVAHTVTLHAIQL